ncbi:hypothetical protein ACQJBY_062773 [Aegilops geniculata]
MLMASHTDTVVSSLNLAPESNGLHRLVHHYFSPRMLLHMLASWTRSDEETGDLRIHRSPEYLYS